MLPYFHHENNVLYVLDVERKHVHIMDPTKTCEEMYEMAKKHKDIVVNILKNLKRRVRVIFEDCRVPAGPCQFEYNAGMHPSCER
jgi:predicted glycosyltransferase